MINWLTAEKFILHLELALTDGEFYEPVNYSVWPINVLPNDVLWKKFCYVPGYATFYLAKIVSKSKSNKNVVNRANGKYKHDNPFPRIVKFCLDWYSYLFSCRNNEYNVSHGREWPANCSELPSARHNTNSICEKGLSRSCKKPICTQTQHKGLKYKITWMPQIMKLLHIRESFSTRGNLRKSAKLPKFRTETS